VVVYITVIVIDSVYLPVGVGGDLRSPHCQLGTLFFVYSAYLYTCYRCGVNMNLSLDCNSTIYGAVSTCLPAVGYGLQGSTPNSVSAN
jgi:uncharacterized protein (DUF983 family)